MSYLPTLCDGCHRASLVSVRDFQHGPPLCARCSQELRVIPSCSYTQGDVALFDELSETVAEGCVTASDAQQLGRDVAQALWAGTFNEGFESLAARLPGLLPLQLVIGTNARGQQRVFQMLKTIFDALTLTRRSGTMTAVNVRGPTKRLA